jgi:hypothetical protein
MYLFAAFVFPRPVGELGPSEPVFQPRHLGACCGTGQREERRGVPSSRTIRKALGQQFQGLQSTPTTSGAYDIAAYAEVHCDGKDDANKYANDINPGGRPYFTWWLVVRVGQHRKASRRHSAILTSKTRLI